MFSKKELDTVIQWQLTGIEPKFKRFADRDRFFKKYNNVKVKPYYNSHKVFLGKERLFRKKMLMSFLNNTLKIRKI